MRKYVRKLRASKLKKYVEFIGASVWILIAALVLESLVMVAVKAAYIVSILIALVMLWTAMIEDQQMVVA